MRVSLHFYWFNWFDRVEVGGVYWLSPVWLALFVLLSVTVSEGC